jgi:hypothetical protein
MSKRERRANQGLGTAESETDSGATMSLEELARAGYSLPQADADSGRLVAKPISIQDILPDPKQPRRQIPSIIRQHWDGQSVGTLFNTWATGFAHESGRQLGEIEAFVEQVLQGKEVSPAEVYQGEQSDPKRNWGVIGGALMAVVNLAAEIRRDGLTNPITIVRVGNQFLIETGERRWLAFNLLNIFYPDSAAWKRIPAREVTASSVWRQASENTARAQLNAISMARQLAILLMDLYGNEQFQSYDELVQPGMCDRAFYAQVDDGNVWRVPRGKGEQLVNAMGITNPVQLRQYRDLLRLPDEVWMLADDLSWKERFIRSEIVEKAVNENGMIALAQFEADSVGYRVTDSSHTVTMVTVSDEEDEAAREEVQDEDPDLGAGATAAPETSPDQNADSDDDESTPDVEPMAEYQLRILNAAYKQAEQGTIWFAPVNVGTSPETLNKFVAQGLLETKGQAVNVSSTVAHYRIAAPGCAAINATVISYPPETQTRLNPPRSGADVHAGAGGNGNTPPVQNDPDPDREQRALEARLKKQIGSMADQLQFSAENFPAEKVLTPEGHEMVKRELKRIFGIARSISDRLPNTKKFA